MAKNNNDITLLIGAEFDKDVRSSLQKELENMGLSTEVSAKLADDARADLLKEIRAITSENKKLAPIDVKARINERSKKTINQYLKRLKERDVEINLELAEKSVAELEKKFDSFGAKIAKKISDELSKSLNIKFDTGGLGLKEANAGIKRIAEMRASLQKLKGELSQIGSGKYAGEAVYNAALAQVSNIDTALVSGDIDKMGLALGEATESARALRREIGEIENAIKKIGKRDLGNELKELLGHKDATASAKSELQEAYNRIMEGFDTKDANGQIAAIKELDKAFSEYAATLKKVAEVRTEAGKDGKSLDKVLGGKSMFSGSAQPSDLVSEYDALVKRANEANVALDNVKASGEGYDAVHKKVTDIVSEFEELCARVDEYKAKTKGDALTLRKEKLSSQIDTLIGSHPKVAKDNALVTQLRQIQAEIAKADGSTLSNLENEFRNLNRTATQTGLKVESFGNKVSNMFKKFTGWFSVSQIVMQTVNYVKQFGHELVEVDTYLTEISKTSNKTAAELSKLGNASGDAAKRYGAAITGYLEGIQEMSRAGYNDKGQAEAMASLSILAQSAGAVTAEVANQFLIATDASYQFKGNINELTKVLDGANGITNKYAVNLTDIASGMSIAGASASQFNVQVDELAAAIGTMNAVTQLGGETSARAFRYLMGVLSKTTGDYDGEIVDTESLSKAEKALGAIGVKMAEVRDGVTHLRNPMQILKEVSTALQGLESTDARKADVLNALGGTNRQASVAALLNNFTMYEQMLSTYASSVGSAEAEALKTAESIQGRLNNIATTIVQIFDNLANSNTIRNTLSVFEGLLTLLEKVTGAASGLSDVGTLFATIGNALSLFYNIGFDGNKIWAGIKDFSDGKDFDIKGGLKSKGQAIVEFTKELWSGKSRIEAYDQAIKDLSASGKEFFEINKETGNAIITNPEKMREAAGGLSAMQLQILDVIDKSGNAGVSMDALGKKFKNVGIKAKLGAVGTKVLGMALTSLVSFGIGVAIDLIVSGIQYVAQSAERAAEAANVARESIEKTASAVEAAGKKVDGTKKKYEELGEAYDELRKKAERVGGWDNLSTEDYDRYVELSGEIIELFPNVDSAFDSNYNHIVTLTDGVKGLNDEYEKLLQQQREEIANSGQTFWKDFKENNEDTIKNANLMQEFYNDFNSYRSGGLTREVFETRWRDMFNRNVAGSIIEDFFGDAGYSKGSTLGDYGGLFNNEITDAEIAMVNSVYGSVMKSAGMAEVDKNVEYIKKSLISKFQLNDNDKELAGEYGFSIIEAYINSLGANDLLNMDYSSIDVVKQEIANRIFSDFTSEEMSKAGSAYNSAQSAVSLFMSGSLNYGDYKAQIDQARKDMIDLYGDEEFVDSLINLIPQQDYISGLYDFIAKNSRYESGGNLNGALRQDIEIVYDFVYNGERFTSYDALWAAVEDEKNKAIEEASASPLNYDNYINGYEQTSAANDRLIERVESQMGQATNITERNQIADRLASIYDEELLNLEGLVEALEADLANYDLSDEIKDAIAGGDSSLVDLSDVNKDLVDGYETAWDMRQSALDRIATITSKRDATASGKADAVREFYDREIAWRQMAVDAQNDYLSSLEQTEGEARQERYGKISTLYGAMKDEAQKSYDILSGYYTQRFDEDSAFAESAEGKALISMIIEFGRYINEYAELEKEARTNEANAPIIARAEAAKQAMEDAAREREMIAARRQYHEAQGYETYAGDDGELAYLEMQISESEKYIAALEDEQANLEIGSDEYLAKAKEISEAERMRLGYLQEQAECYKQMKDEADAFVKAQKAAHDEAVGQLEDEAAFAKERGIVTDEQYDRLSEQYALQADIRRKEIADKKAEMAEDMAAGKYAYGSTRWYEEYLDLMQLEGELTNLIRKEEELERARMDASTNPYENALGAIGSAQSLRQSERELAESTGDFSGAIAYYSAQIKNSEDQIDLLEEINERKQDYLDYLVEEYGEAVKVSDIYREIQDEINGNAESIIDAKKAMKEYTDAIERAAYVGSELDAFGQSKDQFSPEQAVASMIEAKEAIEEGFKSGYTNSKSFVAAWEAMIGDYETTFLALSDPQKKKVFEGASKYLTDGISGQIKFFKDLSKKAGSKDYFNFVDGVAVGLKEVDLAKFVEWSGFSESFVRAMAAGMAAGSPDFSISSNWEEVAEEEQTAVEVVDEFTTKVEELAGKNIGDLGMGATEAAAAGVISRLAEIAQAIINMPTLNISGVTLPSATVSGRGGVEIGGASAARGSINSRGGRTLVGELGPEIVVSGDEWRLVGKNGAEFTNLKQGDIVFNHLESQEILKKRSSKGIGGQAKAGLGTGARSWEAVLDGLTKIVGGKKLKRRETIGGDIPSSGSGGKKGGSGSGSNSNDTKLDWVDWIEVRLKRLADITQKWVDAAARAIGYQIQNAQLENAILAKQDEITNNQAGYERYMKQADSVGLSSDLKTRVQDGTIDINQYDDTTRNLINEYQTWYEKALDCKKAVDELKDAQKELAEEKLENILTHYDNRIDRVDSATDRQEAVIERKIAQGKEVLASDYEALLEENERRAQLLTDQYNALNAEFTSLVDRGLIEEGSDAWFEYRQELAKIDEELIQADIDAQGYIDDMNDLALASLEYAQDMLKHTQSTIERMMDLHETQKEALTFKEYSSLIENGMQQIENLGKQIDHFKKLQEGLEVGSDKYREYQQEIENLEADILDIKISQEEWNDALLDLKITELEKARDEYEKQNETLEKQLELEEAIAELNRAKTQRNKLIYREDGTGYRYEADAKAVRDAQKELDELMHDQLMDKIDEAIDAIEDLKGDENLYDYNAELIPYDGSLELHLSQSMADEILNGLQNTGVLDVLKQGVASGLSSKASSVSIAIGDVIVQEAGDADALAEEIVNTLPLSIIQKVNAK